jgi:hypothetical protein
MADWYELRNPRFGLFSQYAKRIDTALTHELGVAGSRYGVPHIFARVHALFYGGLVHQQNLRGPQAAYCRCDLVEVGCWHDG